MNLCVLDAFGLDYHFFDCMVHPLYWIYYSLIITFRCHMHLYYIPFSQSPPLSRLFRWEHRLFLFRTTTTPAMARLVVPLPVPLPTPPLPNSSVIHWYDHYLFAFLPPVPLHSPSLSVVDCA